MTSSTHALSTSVLTIDNVMCSGIESRLSECSYYFHNVNIDATFGMECKNCKSSIFALPWVMLHVMDLHHFNNYYWTNLCFYFSSFMFSFTDDCSTGDIRLIGGESEREGRVEVCNNRRWGTVCGKQWTNNHTAVVCRFLGFSDLPTGELHSG